MFLLPFADNSAPVSKRRKTESAFSDSASPIPKTTASKVRGVALPQEFEMDYFLRNITNRHPSWNTDRSLCKWEGVLCWKEGKVSEVRWGNYPIDGTLWWDSTPHSLLRLELHCGIFRENALCGDVKLAALPDSLERLYLWGQSFSGEIDTRSLPRSLLILQAYLNKFSGSLDLTILPSGLFQAFLNNNQFEGEINLRVLPASLEQLSLSWNHFTGIVDISSLPEVMFSLCHKWDPECEDLPLCSIRHDSYTAPFPSSACSMGPQHLQ